MRGSLHAFGFSSAPGNNHIAVRVSFYKPQWTPQPSQRRAQQSWLRRRKLEIGPLLLCPVALPTARRPPQVNDMERSQLRHRMSGLSWVVCNPFYVLGLTPAARAAEVTLRYRALVRDLRGGRRPTFTTPHGVRPLDAALLAFAHRELRDPDRRLEHELRYVPTRTAKPRLSVVRTEPA